MVDLKTARICVTGGAGFLGHFVLSALADRGVPEGNLFVPRRSEFDLTRLEDVRRLYDSARPDIVIHLAAEVGGIGANREQPGRFFYANMAMGLHLIEEARVRSIQKFVFAGTVCAYPKHTPVPFSESSLWDGYPEETNAPYGVAKKSLFVMLDAYHRQYGLAGAVVLPTNLYGPRDDFDLQTSHVIPALIRKCESARLAGQDIVECWGTGAASRDFLYVKDAAEGVVRAVERIETPEPINLGSGHEVTIKSLAETIAATCGFAGELRWDPAFPDGQPRRCLDSSRALERLGWTARTPLQQGLTETVAWWRESGG